MDDRLSRLVVAPDATLRTAMQVIDQGACAIALAADGAHRLIGTVTDGDIRRALLKGASLDDALDPFVAATPTIAAPDTPRADVLDLMRARFIEHVPVVDAEGRLVGLHVLREMIGAEVRDNRAVIMAGGRGTRLGQLTSAVPKPMLEVAGRPILERIVLHLLGNGFRHVLLSVNYLAEAIEDHFGDGSRFGCDIAYLREDPATPLGTAGSLALIPDQVGMPRSPFLVMNGDLISQFAVADLFGAHEAANAAVTVGTKTHVYEVPFGVIETSDGLVQTMIEKPSLNWQVNAGVYVVNPSVLSRIPQGQPYDMPALVSACLTDGQRVHSWPLEADWIDVGRPLELHRARGELA